MHCFEEIYWSHENLFDSERYVDLSSESLFVLKKGKGEDEARGERGQECTGAGVGEEELKAANLLANQCAFQGWHLLNMTWEAVIDMPLNNGSATGPANAGTLGRRKLAGQMGKEA